MSHFLLFIVSILFIHTTWADNTASLTINVKTAIEQQLKSINPDIPIETIEKSPVDGISTIILNSGQVLYMSNNGKYIFEGNLLKVEKGHLSNLTTLIREKSITRQLASIKVGDMIVFTPSGKTKGIVYVFTDVDCGFCRRLHQEIPALNAKGIELRYLAFPRGGEEAPAYHKMVSAWCSPDRQAAMSALKKGQGIPEKACENPVNNQLNLGIQLGVTGTPTLFFDNGKSLPGYRPAKDIAELMGL